MGAIKAVGHACLNVTWLSLLAAAEVLDAPVLWLYAFDKEYWLVWPRRAMLLVPPAEVDAAMERSPRQEAELYLLMPNGELSGTHKLSSSRFAAV